MSVFLEFSNVIVRRSAVQRSYPGGLAQFERDIPNASYCADQHLVRVGFMSSRDAEAFVEKLEERGLRVSSDDDSDICVVDHSGPTGPCGWLRFELDDQFHARCWWAGDEPGGFVVPQAHPREHGHGQAGSDAVFDERLVREVGAGSLALAGYDEFVARAMDFQSAYGPAENKTMERLLRGEVFKVSDPDLGALQAATDEGKVKFEGELRGLRSAERELRAAEVSEARYEQFDGETREFLGAWNALLLANADELGGMANYLDKASPLAVGRGGTTGSGGRELERLRTGATQDGPRSPGDGEVPETSTSIRYDERGEARSGRLQRRYGRAGPRVHRQQELPRRLSR